MAEVRYNQSSIHTPPSSQRLSMFTWEDYSPCPFVTKHPARLRHSDVINILEKLEALRPGSMKLHEFGKSYEGRALYSATLGSGPVRIFVWSQMHGNEPTHTAVLFDLIDLLQRPSENPVSKAVLAECTLMFVPMLNPDGAERYIRRTAQDIDMNRDALHLATPEGRLLRLLVEEFKPHFAFNLHNQQPGTSVDGFKPAAVSLLVPPIDPPDTQTEWTQQARQVAVVFHDAVKPHCEGMISRYDADFMPRCFGEWVQQQKVATLTVEAGGWSTVDVSPLVQLHFLGMINALEAIANGCYASVDPANYDRLPRSSDQYVFDVMIRSAQVVPGGNHAPFEADLGINYKFIDDSVPVERAGVIDDFGDLCLTGGKTEYTDTSLFCVPGRIVYEPTITPVNLPTDSQAKEWLSRGVTTIIGKIDLNEAGSITALRDLPKSKVLPINVGFVAECPTSNGTNKNAAYEAIAAGVLAFTGEGVENYQSAIEIFKVPMVTVQELATGEAHPTTITALADSAHKLADQLGLKSRSTIKLGTAADLLFFVPETANSFSWNSLKRVMLGGKVAWQDGKFTPGASGGLLLR